MLPPIFILLGYIFGSIPFGLVLTQAAGLGDIRAIGSGNIGATNVLRTGNKKVAAATLVLDGVKGAVAIMLAHGVLLGPAGTEAGLWAGLGAVLGHLFPVWLKFKGGKGVATGLGVLIAVAWPVGLLACATWALVAAALRRSSLAALLAFAAAPFFAFALANLPVVYLSLTIAVLVWVRHHENIRRILAGTEPRIGHKA
ncbi:MAG: glycerol-3-phosphate 1-O-acyltransferase PlsY [Rhodospirillales bacterium]